MKTINFKMYPLMIIASALLVLSGCDGTTGIVSDSGIGAETPAPAPTPPPTPTPVPDAGTSTVTSSPVTIAADGLETSTITVTVNDASSNPVTNAIVTLAQTGTSTISTVTNVGDGTYTFIVKSTTAETVTYSATADGVTITQTADVTFTQTEAQCLAAAGPGYGTIVINNRTWLDRNLGAGQVATDANDSFAYGDLYQWGRAAEGHEDTASTTIQGTHADTILPNLGNAWDGMFITEGGSGTNFDWTISSVDTNGSERSSLWSSAASDTNLNQVCPCGYVVPTEQDFSDLNPTDPNFVDTFKLAAAGNRRIDGSPFGKERFAYFWTSDTGVSNETHSKYFRYDTLTGDVGQIEGQRIYGFSIRCIKPQ